MTDRILVTAPEGRKTPIASSDGAAPGGGQLYVEQGDIIAVPYSSTVRRSIQRGDLIPCTESGLAADDLADAQAPEDFEPVFAVNRNRPAEPDDQQPLPDSGNLQRDRVRRKPPPAPHNPLPQPPGTTIPGDVSMKSAHPNMDASGIASFDADADLHKGR